MSLTLARLHVHSAKGDFGGTLNISNISPLDVHVSQYIIMTLVIPDFSSVVQPHRAASMTSHFYLAHLGSDREVCWRRLQDNSLACCHRSTLLH